MRKRIIIVIGTLDTRGEEIGYLSEKIAEKGHESKVMDVGVLGDIPFKPAISRDQVAQAAGTTIKEIIALHHEGRAMTAMAEGASKIIHDFLEKGEVDGVIAAGGSMSTSLALDAMRSLPMGLPKMIVSTIAFSPLVTPESVPADLSMMLWPAGLYGLNEISRKVLSTAAGAIAGAAENFTKGEEKRKRTVGITSLGTSQLKFVETLKPALEERGYDVAIFHTVGMGGRAYEKAITDGLVDVALDLSLVELVDQVVGGATTSGSIRLQSAGKRGIPQIVGAAGISNFFWFSGKPLPPALADRKHHRHNQLLTIVTAETEEKEKVGELVAERLNNASGPAAVVIPLVGSIEGDRHPKSPFHDPEGGRAFAEGLKSKLKPEIEVIELDAHANDPAFSETILKIFDQVMAQA
jgi:uncharacterized protein (UPF0261 family)